MDLDEEDVPTRVDFRDPATARTWIEETRIKRSFRPNFFAAFCAALSSRRQLRILELGPGPGLSRASSSFTATFTPTSRSIGSQAMHALAAEHLGELARRVTFVARDFRAPTWPTDFGTFDAIVTMQARTRPGTDVISFRCSNVRAPCSLHMAFYSTAMAIYTPRPVT